MAKSTPETGTTDSDEVVVINGEEYRAEDLTGFVENGGPKWQASMKQKDQEIATEKNTLEAQKTAVAQKEAAVAEKERALAVQQQEPPKQKEPAVPAPAAPVLDLTTDMPNQLDDPAAFNAELARRTTDYQQGVAKQIEDRLTGNAKAQADATTRKVDQAVNGVKVSAAREADFARNEKTLGDYFDEHPEISVADRKQISSVTNSMLRLPGYGEQGDSGVTVFNPAAIEAADRVVRRDHYDTVAKDLGYEAGLSQRSSNTGVPRNVAMPGKGATPEAIWNAGQQVTGEANQRKWLEALEPGQLEEMLLYEADTVIAQAGQ